MLQSRKDIQHIIVGIDEQKELWQKAIDEHNKGDYHEAHELFEDLWMELDNRTEKDTVQTLAQADALAVHLQSEIGCCAEIDETITRTTANLPR